MIYPYYCASCQQEFEVIKSVQEIDNEENCPLCDNISVRRIARRQSIDKTAAGDWNNASYNPAFGRHLTPMQARNEAKRRGWTEVGTEPKEKIEKHFAQERQRKQKKSWDEFNLDVGEVRSS